MTDETTPPKDTPLKGEPPKGERIAKLMARAGLCSRRDAERWIAEGRVQVDGKPIDTAALVIDDPTRVRVDGKSLKPKDPPKLWRYHKPPGLVTTHKDEEGRPTVFDTLPPSLPRVVSVGRLDLNSEGLLLLTNDGGMARELELPSTGWVRTYRVRVFGHVTPEILDSVKDGCTVDGIHYGPIDAKIEKKTGRNAWLIVSLSEGKNREIRQVMRHLELHVNRLIRQAYGPFRLGDLERGEVREVPPRQWMDQLGVQLESAGVVSIERINKTGWAKAKAKPKSKPRPKPREDDKRRGKPAGRSTGKPAGKPMGKPTGKPQGRKRTP
ncbi:MAG: rRNA pseudouridine synthase [Rhodospirillales bacterium]|nr:rRNA pseudouridine synthase [Rhodospirillales bacterium]